MAPGVLRSVYDGQQVLLATMHGKARAIAPAFQEKLGLSVVEVEGIDTDQFGTFTGDVARPGTMLDAARAKLREGLARSGAKLGLASEGSFGPLPEMPMVPCAREVLLFHDTTRGIEVFETHFSLNTNFNSTDVHSLETLETFLEQVGFPQHAVVVMPVRGAGPIVKGLNDRAAVKRAVQLVQEATACHLVRVASDMRAHVNPTRMAEISLLAGKLASRLATFCPQCDCPGFGWVRSLKGLPCAECGCPTELTKADIHGCHRCSYVWQTQRSDGLQHTGPEHCPQCNP